MVDHPQETLNEKFDPDYVATLRKILDIAVEQIALENRTPATKAKMASKPRRAGLHSGVGPRCHLPIWMEA